MYAGTNPASTGIHENPRDAQRAGADRSGQGAHRVAHARLGRAHGQAVAGRDRGGQRRHGLYRLEPHALRARRARAPQARRGGRDAQPQGAARRGRIAARRPKRPRQPGHRAGKHALHHRDGGRSVHQPSAGGGRVRRDPVRGRNQRPRQPRAVLHPPAHQAVLREDARQAQRDHPQPLAVQIPSGHDHHPARRALRAASARGQPAVYQWPGARPVCQRRDAVHRAGGGSRGGQ